MKSKEQFFGRLVIFVIFIFIAYYFYADINAKFISIKSKRNMQTNNIIMNFKDKLRLADFYKDVPSYPFERKKKEKPNLKSEEKVLNEIKKETLSVDKKEKASDSEKVSNKYYLQIATYSSEENANGMVSKLKEYNAGIEESIVKDKKYYKVVVSNIETREKAHEISKEIKKFLGNKENPLVRVRY